MRILYISPENTVGTLTLWKKEHEKRNRTANFYVHGNAQKAGHLLETQQLPNKIQATRARCNHQIQTAVWTRIGRVATGGHAQIRCFSIKGLEKDTEYADHIYTPGEFKPESL